jgi:hypothetical protein
VEDLVGYRVERNDGAVVGVPPSGDAVRLHRLPPARADALVALLSAATGEHVEALLDVGTAVNGDTVLVLPELPTALADLLARGIAPGEAVTVLAPLAATVARLHEQGIAHGALGVHAVRFDARGAPVLTGFGAGLRREPGGTAEPAFLAAAAGDDAGLRGLAGAVLRAAGPAAAPLAAEFASGQLSTEALPAALFALADPAPVRLDAQLREKPDDEPPGRLVAPAAPALLQPSVRRLSRLPGAGAARSALTSSVGALRAVRLRIWVVAAASLALLAGALVLLPGRGAAGAPEPRPVASATSRAPASARAAPPTEAAPPIPTEPLAAARALLAARRSCLLHGSTACLARVESAGSPILIEDAAVTAGAVEPVLVPESRLRLRSTSGGTAVLAAGDRTVLLVREPDGWRLRDAIGPPTRGSTARSTSGGG